MCERQNYELFHLASPAIPLVCFATAAGASVLPLHHVWKTAPVGGVVLGTSPADLDRLVVESSSDQDNDSPTHYSLISPRKGNAADSTDRYYSPYYHHITLSNLKPSTTYYYRPVVQATAHELEVAFQNNNLRRPVQQQQSEAVARDFQEVQEDEATQGESNSRQRRYHSRNRNRRRRRRSLIEWGPYNGSERECPSPDRIRSFRTAPPVPEGISGGIDQTLQLAVVGDLGQFPHSEEVLARMLHSKSDLDALILAGDVAYTTTDHRRWDTFMDFLEDYPIAETIPMMLCPGNHDIDKEENGTGIFLAYEHRFRMPRVRPPQLGEYDGPLGSLNMDRPPYPLPYEWGNAYYAYTYGPARILMINAYSSMERNSTQYNWIVSELEQIDRSITPWVLAVLHTPLYNTFSLHQHDYQSLAAKEHLEPLFVQHRVNVVFSGHIHAYLRTTTVAHGIVDPTGPMHVTIGAGGRKCEAPFLNETPEDWVQVRDATVFGYGVFRIRNRTHAEWDWIHTGLNEHRSYNQLYHSNVTLPPGPGRDRDILLNQFFL